MEAVLRVRRVAREETVHYGAFGWRVAEPGASTYLARRRAWRVYVPGASPYLARLRTWRVAVHGASTYLRAFGSRAVTCLR